MSSIVIISIGVVLLLAVIPIVLIMRSSSSVWETGEWTVCSKECGGGYQMRTVTCKTNIGCKEDSKPINYRVCNTGPCGEWTIGSWGECKKGVQLRSVDCPTGTVCHSTKPDVARECTEGNWIYSDWSECSVQCGGGIQKRTAVCSPTDSTDSTDSTGSTCTTTPILQQNCNTGLCIGDWNVGVWSDCVGGVQIRSVDCPTGMDCSGKPKPIMYQTCSSNTGSWTYGSRDNPEGWSACSTTCGTGQQSRAVSCTPIGASCDPQLKPLEYRTCTQSPCPWQYIDGSCSKPCGGGVRTRTAWCPTGGNCLSSEIGNLISECNTQMCPTGAWTYGNWSDCSTQCGTGTQTRNVYCPTDKYCPPDTKPTEKQNCTLGPCGYWNTSAWSECSKPCGGGAKTRSVVCKTDTGTGTPICLDTKPSEIETCNTQPCEWTYSNWSACSATCGNGIQARTVSCPLTGHCASTQPATSQVCTGPPCLFTSGSSLTTNFDIGSSDIGYLDRHRLSCPSGGIQQMKLERSTDGNNYRYNYKCSAGGRLMGSSPFVTPQGEKNPATWYLDRHNIACPSNQTITSLQLIGDTTNVADKAIPGKMYYKYSCAPIDGNTTPITCRSVSTPAEIDGGGNAIYLDRQNIQCNSDEVLTQLRLKRPSSSTIAYDYTCCKY